MSAITKVKERIQAIDRRAAIIPAAGVGAVIATVPTFAFAEGEPATVQSAVTGMATSVASDGQAMLVAVVPVLAPLVAAIIIATIGFTFVKRFSK